MTSSEMAGMAIILGFYRLLLFGAIKLFGMRRVLWFFVLLTILGVSIAYRSLGVITGWDRRY